MEDHRPQFTFIFYSHNLCANLSNAFYPFYTDDSVIYCCSSLSQTIGFLQSAFNIVQTCLHTLNLVLNVEKIKQVVFMHSQITAD